MPDEKKPNPFSEAVPVPVPDEPAPPAPPKKTAASEQIPWAKLVKLTATPEKLQEALWNAGLRTSEDLTANPRWAQVALGALQAVYGVDLNTLLVGYDKHLSEQKDKEKVSHA